MKFDLGAAVVLPSRDGVSGAVVARAASVSGAEQYLVRYEEFGAVCERKLPAEMVLPQGGSEPIPALAMARHAYALNQTVQIAPLGKSGRVVKVMEHTGGAVRYAVAYDKDGAEVVNWVHEADLDEGPGVERSNAGDSEE